jgi:NTE family protein
MGRTLLGLLALLPLLSACAHYPLNDRLPPPYPAHMGYRYENLGHGVANTDSTLVVLAFSGGGTRAGAMAYGVVRELANTRIAHGTKRLLDEVDIISAASGGSFAAAFYGLVGPKRFLEEFPRRVLGRDLGMGTFWRGTLCPYNLVRLCSPWFNRSDLAAELYTDEIYGDATFADLQRHGRPFIVLNGTELVDGVRFEFTQDRFDRLGSSLSRVPLARAVAASAAFPFLLTPVAFRDYTADAERYVHVIDGGVVDNRGIGYVLESFQRGALRRRLDAGGVERLVFIVVNARNRLPDELGCSPQAPGTVSVLSLGLGAAIDRRGEDQEALLRELCRREDSGTAVRLVEVDLADIPDTNRRERLLATETTFGLPEETVGELADVAGELLAHDPVFAEVRAALQ